MNLSVGYAVIKNSGYEPSVWCPRELADGMDCSDVTQQDSQPSTVEVFNEEKDTLRAEVRAIIHFGSENDQRTEFKAYLHADAWLSVEYTPGWSSLPGSVTETVRGVRQHLPSVIFWASETGPSRPFGGRLGVLHTWPPATFWSIR